MKTKIIVAARSVCLRFRAFAPRHSCTTASADSSTLSTKPELYEKVESGSRALLEQIRNIMDQRTYQAREESKLSSEGFIRRVFLSCARCPDLCATRTCDRFTAASSNGERIYWKIPTTGGPGREGPVKPMLMVPAALSLSWSTTMFPISKVAELPAPLSVTESAKLLLWK